MTDVLFIDAFSGVSGDMLVAALLDLGVPRECLEDALRALPIEASIAYARMERSGIHAARFSVEHRDQAHERTYVEIARMIERAPLTPGTRARALGAFRLLAEAEAAVHGTSIDEVHFHEVGAIDSIVDIVGASALLDRLGAEVVCSPLPMGHGFVRSRHGVLPLPAPATVHCLRGVPTYDAGIEAELVTPTGACLVATCASRFDGWPAMRPRQTGWGAGTRELPDRPNLLRVVLGEATRGAGRRLVILEANVDDASAEHVAYALDRFRSLGARDVWTTPIAMKKGRSAVCISLLVEPEEARRMADAVLTETPSLGVRVTSVERIERPRRSAMVETAFGAVPVKVADGDGLPRRVKPEYEACASLARAAGVPIDEVYQATLRAHASRE